MMQSDITELIKQHMVSSGFNFELRTCEDVDTALTEEWPEYAELPDE